MHTEVTENSKPLPEIDQRLSKFYRMRKLKISLKMLKEISSEGMKKKVTFLLIVIG